MEKLTGEQILAILREKDVDYGEFAYDNFDSEELGLGKCVEIAQKGGSDQGSEWYSVKHFVDHDVYIRIDGYYSSGNGTDFDDVPYVVTPKQKTITVYEQE